MFLPVTKEEIQNLGWQKPDIILISGDSYIDSPYIGIAVIGKYLLSKGFKVAVIAQPDTNSPDDIMRLGEPALFWAVTGGSVDSMVANYTASGKKRKQDDFTPGAINNRRPDRAVIVYSNLIRRYFKNTKPIVLGGIEASLRRLTHYDYWDNKIRRPVILDAKADYLVYGMAEKATLELACSLKNNTDPAKIRGLCYIANQLPFQEPDLNRYLELPSYEACSDVSPKGKLQFLQMFRSFYDNNDPITAKGLYQKVAGRYVIQNPPAGYAPQKELDSYYDLDFEREQHPYYEKLGRVRALETIRFGLTTHRGCYGECNFCAITVHQGRTILSRSQESIIKEAKSFTKKPNFKGIISDVGGPTANMYGEDCPKKITKGACMEKRCVFPQQCEKMKPDHGSQIHLLKQLRALPAVRHVFVASGLRYDLILQDKKHGLDYLKELATYHVSGQMKIAPEHTDPEILKLMGKPQNHYLETFVRKFNDFSQKANKKQFLTYYFIAAHPGCTEKDMQNLKNYARKNLAINPEQVQIYTPTPSTWSSVMYYTGLNPFDYDAHTGQYKKIPVEKNPGAKDRQKEILTVKPKGLQNTHADHHNPVRRKKNGNQFSKPTNSFRTK